MKFVPGFEFGILVTKSVQYDTNPCSYRNGDIVGFSSPKWSWKEKEVFTKITNKDDVVTHVSVEHEIYSLDGNFVLDQLQLVDLPKELQVKYIKLLEEFEIKQKTKEGVYDIIAKEVIAILNKYPNAYLYSFKNWKEEIISSVEDISKAEYIKYILDNNESINIDISNRFNDLYYQKDGENLFDKFEKTLFGIKRFVADMPFIISKFPNNWKENDYIYFVIDEVTVRIKDYSGNYINESVEQVLLSRLEKEKQTKAKVPAYEDKKKMEQQAYINSLNEKNEGLCRLILKKFPKAQIIKRLNKEWCVNSDKVTLSTFCKQNGILIPKNLK